MSRLLTENEATQFATVLQNYKPNHEVLTQFRESNFGVIAGPAGAGKDTLRNSLIAEYPYTYLPILSTTTRPPRAGEIDGQEYHFREIEEVQEGLDHQDFFQTALVHGQQVSCLHIDEIRKLKAGQWGISILIPSTEKELREMKSDIKTIFLVPPDLQTLKQRMQAGRKLTPDELDRRLQAAKTEMITALNEDSYYCIVSEDIPAMIAKAHAFLQGKNNKDRLDNHRVHQVIRRILSDLSES